MSFRAASMIIPSLYKQEEERPSYRIPDYVAESDKKAALLQAMRNVHD